jgi:predicted TIM-barrel fold metal-dependent hydrolase
MAVERVPRRVIDGHSHIGEMGGWKYYGAPEPVHPTVYEFSDVKAYLVDHLDRYGVERGLVLPNYGHPVQEQAFGLNPVVLDAAASSDRVTGGLWVSFLPQNKELTMEALKHAGESGIVALKTTFLLGGTPNPEEWDDDTKEIAEACFDAAEAHDLVFHFHTSPGGASDINNYVPMIERYSKRVKTHLVHFGGGTSGHIKLGRWFLDWVEQGYKVYADTTWAVGFGTRFLLTEIERRGVGQDRVLFASDEPWSDFMGEYWKIEGAPVSKELKERVFVTNFEELYGDKG